MSYWYKVANRRLLSETLTGLATVRAYSAQVRASYPRLTIMLAHLTSVIQGRFIRTAEQGLDGENRAYYMTITIQRWLGVRLDFLGNILILGICLFAVGFRNTLNPSLIGVVLSYSLGSEYRAVCPIVYSLLIDLATTVTQTFCTCLFNYSETEFG